MIFKIKNDVPKDLIRLVHAIDFSKVSKAQFNDWFPQLKNIAGKYLKKSNKRPGSYNVTLDDNVPTDLIVEINSYDFNIPNWKKQVALPIIRNWLRKNVPQKGCG